MSATRPDMAMTPPSSLPLFPLAFRGYDRELVDARLAGLAAQLEKERQRGDQAERALRQFKLDVKEGRAQVPAWFANVGAEVDRVVDEAGTAAAKLLAQAGRRIQEAIDAAEAQAAERLRAVEEQTRQLQQAANETLAEAQTARARIEAEAAGAAEETRAKADLEAKALLARAGDEARLIWEQATRERQQIEAESERLTTLRQAMVDQLVQVYAPLGLTLVDTRLDSRPGAQDGHPAEAGEQVPAAVTNAGPVGGEQPVRPEARSERGGGGS